MSKNYPKILIIGQYFDLRSGGGITNTNLFKGWDKNNIAVASESIINPDYSVCEKFYQLGAKESKKRFPFNLKSQSNEPVSGLIPIKPEKWTNNKISKKEAKFSTLYNTIIDYTGVVHYRNKLIISNEFLNWIKEYSPDFIYTQLSTYRLIIFISNLYKILNIPIAIHMMDDWPTSICQKGIMRSYWNRKIDLKFRYLVSESKVLMSISESMSEAYYARYGKTFLPFHNPIEINDWLPFSKSNYSITGICKVLYTGRIGTANNKSILFISEVISILNQSGSKIQLDVYTQDTHAVNAELISACQGIEVKSTLPHNAMPSLLASYDLLILPLDFDEEGINFARYSMPTKASEYMISGTPIIVFADAQTALAKYASQIGWAYVVSQNNSALLISAFKQLISDEYLRKSIAEKAKINAIQNEDATIVREKFRQCFLPDAERISVS